MSSPIDKPTPEQSLALRAEAPYLLIAASAGTGKTRTLVEKVLRVVRGGMPLERIAVITFTRKAADELRFKLFTAFQDDPSLRPMRLALPQAYISTIDAFCARLLREHGLALEVDPAFRVLASPDDGVVLAEILDRLFDDWYQGRAPGRAEEPRDPQGVPRRGSAPHREFLRLVDLCRYRRGRELLKEEIARLLSLARHHRDPGEFLDALERAVDQDPPPYVPALAKELDQSWRAGRAAYAEVLRLGSERTKAERFARHRELDAALRLAPWPDDERALGRDLPGAITRVRERLAKDGWVTPRGPWKIDFPRLPSGTSELKSLHELAKHLLNSSGEKRASPFAHLPWPAEEMHAAYQATRPAIGTLIALARQTLAAYDEYKQGEGLLDFADLELRTRQLLLDPPPGLRGRFDLVLVDEFQDVNTLQAEIVRRLDPERGRFLVGDIKQCIYQFRLANPEVFRKLVADAVWIDPKKFADDRPLPRAERLVVPLSVNFRSRRPVIETVNAVFEELLTKEMIGCDYRSVALRYGYEAGIEGSAPLRGEGRRERGCAPSEIHVLACEAPPDEASGRRRFAAGELLEAEARLVAQRLRDLRASGFEVFDRRRSVWRRADWGDMAILLRAPAAVGGRFAQALRAARVPSAFGIQPFFEREEIRDALNLLRVLDNAHDDIGLAGLMRTPTVGFDDDDLLLLRLARPGSPSLIAALRDLSAGAGDEAGGRDGEWLLDELVRRDLVTRARTFLERLDRWRLRAQSCDLADAVAAACDEAGLLAAAASRDGAVERAGNVQQLIALARRYATEQGHSLPGFVRYVETLGTSGGGPEAVAAADPAGPAVRILSMHKAKGLEFPIVALPLLGRRFNLRDASQSILTGDRWIGIDHFDPQTYVKTPTLARYLLAEQRLREVRQEELRVLYVAMTRAVEKLILTLSVQTPWDAMLAGLDPWRGPEEVRSAVARRIRGPSDALLGVLHRQGALEALTHPGARISWRELCTVHRHALAAGAMPEEPREPIASGPLPGATPIDEDAARRELPALLQRVSARYAHEPATRWRGKYWVTEVKRLIDRAREEEERAAGSELARVEAPGVLTGAVPGDRAAPASRPAESSPWPASEEGRWLHAILQELDLAAALGARGTGPAERAEALLDCARRLAARGELPEGWISKERLDPLARFLDAPLAAEMAAATELQREASFALRLSPRELAEIWPAAAELREEEWILLQGQIDALWPLGDGRYRLVDFKSDHLAPAAVEERALSYRPQMLLYREALRRVWGATRVAGAIYFLRPGRIVEIF